jgi:hypothetical protein
MRLSWNEIRARAARFVEEWRDAEYESGDKQTFWNEFFEIFGVTRRRVASFEEPVKLLGNRRGYIDLLWKGVLLVEQKSAGQNLENARRQALEYFPGLREHELPHYVLVCDFRTLELYDLDEGCTHRLALHELPRKVELFGFILGVRKRTFKEQDPVNIQASALMGQLHDALKASGYKGHELERFLVRLLFCLFADDTGIFEPRGIFADLIAQRTAEDGSDTGQWIGHLFEVLNTPEDQRQGSLDEDLARFPYVDGDLFAEHLPIPAFNAKMRMILIAACDFNWEAISPAIFGSLFQAVMERAERRAQGGHYTSEKSILKLIEPLFLDDLRAELAQLKRRKDQGRRAAIAAFRSRLGKLRFLDPACGCGNFLIIAYREIRNLEIEALRELRPPGQLEFAEAKTSLVDVDQFFGIELAEFPARIAEVALWMMDHIMNVRLSLEFGVSYVRIPLRSAPHIRCADALEMDWNDLLPASDCDYVLGNPPFGGSKVQSDAQRAQVKRIAALGGSGGTLDYVTAWFIKAGEYVQGTQAKIAFVATNSITQGEQVAQLWPVLFGRWGLEIAFAHRTFAWSSDAPGMAHVHVVIIGLVQRRAEPEIKRLFSYSDLNGDATESLHSALTPYLFDASGLADRHLMIESASRPLSGVPALVIGSKPIDGGQYIFDAEQRKELLEAEPGAARHLRPFIGSEEFVNGGQRWILYLEGASPKELRAMPQVAKRVAAVRKLRQRSISPSTRALADAPTRYHVTVVPERPFLVVPETGSEHREYAPIGWLEPPTIPSNLVKVALNAELWHFAILTSRMHMAWLRFVGGRFKSDPRYSIGIVYNPFPWPELDESAKTTLSALAEAVLKARQEFPDTTLADLYDPNLMPAALRKAHRALDAAVDRLYRATPFGGDRERVEHLFRLYEKLVTPLTQQPKPRRRAERRTFAARGSSR